MQFNIFNLSKIKKPIIFGPFLGELGWEIMRWSGVARYIKTNHRDWDIVIATRRNRYDLYSDLFPESDAFLFDIPGDYDTYIPGHYSSKFMDAYIRESGPIIRQLRKRYSKHFFYEPWKIGVNRKFFNISKMYFAYEPREKNKTIIEGIINKHPDRIPIVIAPRNRIDMPIHKDPVFRGRNWGCENWDVFLNKIERRGDFLVFISGNSPSYCKQAKYRHCFYDLETLAENEENVSSLGLSIEAIKISKFVFSSQSAMTVLSNLLMTPSIMIGHEIKRLDLEENPYGNRFVSLAENYHESPEVIYDKLCKEIENILL